jgi:hypothetical protein
VNGARGNVATINKPTNKEQQKIQRETRINNKLIAKRNTEEKQTRRKNKNKILINIIKEPAKS